MNIFANLHIKEIRELKGVSQNKLAQMIGMTQGYLSKLESNKKSPTLNMLIKIAEVLEVKPCQLYDVLCEYK